MSIFEKERWEVWNRGQHPYRHQLAEFAYANPALPVNPTNVEDALNYIVAVLYPKTKDPVADLAALNALVGNVINDYRVVLDDGDGKAASYRWEQREGEVAASWHKVYDMDWGEGSILANFMTKTQDVYMFRYGLNDKDAAGVDIAGLYAGQHIYGGSSANTNLTLSANSGDGTGARTGYVQVTDHFRPTDNNLTDIGTATEMFRTLYLGTSALISTLTFSSLPGPSPAAAGLITDSNGLISFDDENLVTTGNFTGATGYFTTSVEIGPLLGNALILSPGSVTDESGSISFGDENLLTTGTLGSAAITITEDTDKTLVFHATDLGAPAKATIISSLGTISFGANNLETTGTLGCGALTATSLDVDNLRLDGNTISSLNTDGNIILLPNGSGIVDIQKTLQTDDIDTSGTVDITGQLNIDNLRLDGNTISSVNTDGNIVISPDGFGLIEVSKGIFPTTDVALSLGKSGNKFLDIWITSTGYLQDGTNTYLFSELFSLRSTNYRDVARTTPAVTGDTLFWDSVAGQWIASHPDSEIDHSELTGLTTTDAGHTQFVMLAGRVGGQTVQGGTGASENLTLESTAHATKGNILLSNTTRPVVTAAYSGGWTGTDLGSSSYYFNDIYSRGEHKNMRAENFTYATLPGFSAQNIGRLMWATDENALYADTGAAVVRISGKKFISDVAFNGSDVSKAVTVSGISDARNTMWQLRDNTNNFEVLNVTLNSTDATTVNIITIIPLPAGNYRLIGIEL